MTAVPSRDLTPEQQTAYSGWADAIERDDYVPRPAASSTAIEGNEAARYSREVLDDILDEE